MLICLQVYVGGVTLQEYGCLGNTYTTKIEQPFIIYTTKCFTCNAPSQTSNENHNRVNLNR